MRLTMNTVHQLGGMGISSPLLTAATNAGIAAGLRIEDDDRLLDEVFGEKIIAGLRGESGCTSPINHSVVMVVGSKGGGTVALTADYLSAAEAFLADPSPETLFGDFAAWQRMRAEIDRGYQAGSDHPDDSEGGTI